MIAAAIWKDIQLLLRDRGTLLSLFALPIIFILAFGAMFSTGAAPDEPHPIAIWHPPGQPEGAAIERALAATPGFAPQPEPTADAVRAAVASGDVDAGLVIPADLAPQHGRPVELAIDLAAPIQTRAPLVGALTAIVTRALQPAAARAGDLTYVSPRSPPGVRKPLADISSFQVTVPGNAVLFGFYIALTVAMSFAGERRTGTWRRLLAAPVPRWKVLLATLVPYYVIGCIQLAFLFGLGAAVFGMRVAGSVPALALLSMCVVLCAVCLGLLFASLGGTEKQLGSIGSVVLLVMGLLGGCMFPRLMMPAAMRSIGHAVPHSWALDGYYDLLVREGTSFADIAPSLGALVAFAAGFAVLGLSRFRFER